MWGYPLRRRHLWRGHIIRSSIELKPDLFQPIYEPALADLLCVLDLLNNQKALLLDKKPWVEVLND